MSVPAAAVISAERYVQKGLSKDAACAIVSVLYAGESGLNPGPQPGSAGTDRGGVLYPSGAMGIASWNGPRQQALNTFAQKKGASPWDLNTQLDFVLTECANSYPEVWKFISANPSLPYVQIIPIFVRQYENPKNPQAEIDRALAFARELYPAISSQPVPTTPDPQSSATMPILQIIQIMEGLASIMQALAPVITKVHEDLAKAHAANPQPSPMPATIDIPALAQELGPLLQQILMQLPHPTQAKS